MKALVALQHDPGFLAGPGDSCLRDSSHAGDHGKSRGVLAGVLVCALLLVGCSSKSPVRADDQANASVALGDATVTAPRGGGYYLDDGPGDRVPANLDAIPDAVPRIEPLHPPALRPYTVMGQTFVPRTALTPYRERGHASWYGRRFHGKPTSIGEPYDMFAMTAAHPTLPIPSYARVTNLANGRTVVVRVNDRGPFLRGRLIDLSYAAAYRLGYINSGSAQVEVESILPDEIRLAEVGRAAKLGSSQHLSPPSPAQVSPPVSIANLAPLPNPAMPPVPVTPLPLTAMAAPAEPMIQSSALEGGVFLQLGAFSTTANAQQLADRILRELGGRMVGLHLVPDGGRVRLQMGPYASPEEARFEALRLGALFDLQPFVITR